MSRDFRAGLLVGVVISILFICAIGRLASVFADDWVVATIGSQHLGGGSYCEFNPGVGVELQITENTWFLGGAYRNSLCKRVSAYVGASWLPLQFADWRLGGAAMGLTGYNAPVTPGLSLVASYRNSKRTATNIVWFPNDKGQFDEGVIAIQRKFLF